MKRTLWLCALLCTAALSFPQARHAARITALPTARMRAW